VSRIWQEFYCGECKGYIRVKLNIDLNIGVEVVCPECGHKHHRVVKDGQIFERGRESCKATEEICPPKSAYQKEPWTTAMKELHLKNSWSRRDGVPIVREDVPADSPYSFIRESWLEKYAG
jgi:hypothetical protein